MVSAERLREYPYFRWASPDSLKTLSMVSEDVDCEAGHEWFAAGTPADFLYVVTKGTVEIQFATDSGARRVVGRLEPGDLMVWSAVVEPYMNTSFGVATTDGSVVRIDAERLRQLMAEDCEFGSSLMTELVKVVADRLRGARRQLAALG